MGLPYLSSRLLDGSPREWDLPLLPTERGRSGWLPLLPRWPARSARLLRVAKVGAFFAPGVGGVNAADGTAPVSGLVGLAGVAARQLPDGFLAERQHSQLHSRASCGCLLGHRNHLLSDSV